MKHRLNKWKVVYKGAQAHRNVVNDLCSNIINICLKAGDESFPKVASPKRRIPRWNSDVKPLRDDALFWHHVWKDAGKPSAGALAGIMRNTRAKYHRAVKETRLSF